MKIRTLTLCVLGALVFGLSHSEGSEWETRDTPQDSFANFESPQARPLVVSSNGDRLYAVNTPAASVAVHSLNRPGRPEAVLEIPVGLEPISVAEHTDDELWVVNHVGDSISVVSLSRAAVIATIRVGDRPGDIVFAGDPRRAFVTLMTERRVVVIDPETRDVESSIPIFGEAPRSLLASSDGATVWVAISRSGNGTTVVPHTLAPPPPPPANGRLPSAPQQGMIVDGGDPEWQEQIGVLLPDHDVVELDATAHSVRRTYDAVGTILFNMAERPGTEELWVANTHARNLVRFEPNLRGHVIDSRVTRIAIGGESAAEAIDLNSHVDYSRLPDERGRTTAFSQPTDIAFRRDGREAYVAAMGSDRIAILDSAGAEVDYVEVGDGESSTPRTMRGPRALVSHPSEELLYVLNRLANTISVIDIVERRVLREVPLFDPTPVAIREGRGYLFDARLSGNGTASCASCHVDADRDGLAWDLGDPGGVMFSNGSATPVHPMKGPLLTQTLRGLGSERIFHWRADRPGLGSFNGTFATLLGGEPLSGEDLADFVAYLARIDFAPNPHRQLDNTLPETPEGTSASDGERLFLTRDRAGREGNTPFRCVGCHVNPTGSGGFGFTGLIGQPMKAAPLRGLHERTGRRPTEYGRVSGFGYGADGSKDELETFLANSHRFVDLTPDERTALARFLLAFPTEHAPAVGFAHTLTSAARRANGEDAELALLLQQAEAGNCDLIVKGVLQDEQVGFVYDAEQQVFLPDRTGLDPWTVAQLTASLGRQPQAVLTFMGVPVGNGKRLGIDRDLDGTLDGDE